MAERFLPTEDPVLEQVLSWTVERDARDVRRLLEWLPQARSNRERQALLDRIRDLLNELEQAMSALDELGIDRYCCRRMFVSHIELIKEVAPFSAPRE